MNLRNVGKKGIDYNIGLDLGTGSVGWAVADEYGELFSFKGKTTWGSRLYPTAQTAADTRLKRGQRRRYARRRWRLNLLQNLFEEEINKVDPEFFTRLRQSQLLKEDKTYSVALSSKGAARPLFDKDEEEADYYKKYPTIYHLRKALMEQSGKADIRLIYLAFHNIVKARGNFLYQDTPGLRASNANMGSAIEKLCLALEEWCDLQNLECGIRANQRDIQALLESESIEPTSENKLKEVFNAGRSSRKDKAAVLAGWIGLKPGGLSETFDAKQAKDVSKEIANLVFGLQGNMKKIFIEFEEDHKVRLDNDEQVEEFYAVCPDDGVVLFEALQSVYSAYVLMGILKGADGGSISSCKVAAYDQYKQDLRQLKALVREFAPAKYDEFFRGDIFDARKGFRARNYDPSTAKGYTKYNAVRGGTSYDDFKKEIEKLLKGTSAEEDPRYLSMMNRFAEGTYLRRLKTGDNGSIPYQLHLEEMDDIIENQKQYYPFLDSDKDKIESLVTFRILYYVGPLTLKNAPEDRHGTRFAWSQRKEGMENTRIYPWNWEEVIDRKASAAKFMERLTGTCTYILDEPVLPRNSLLYEEYCLLNEINGAKWSSDGDDWHRFDYGDRMGIIEDLFQKKKGAVKYSAVEDWLKCERHHAHAHVRGGQGETAFESKLSSYMFFKDVLQVDEIDEADIPMIEELIWWNTLFEDRSILKESIEDKYGDRLTADQIKAICKKRFTGWGRLSKKLLCGIKTQTDNGPMSVMDILREGNPNNDDRSKTMVFMEVIRDDKFNFMGLIDEENKERLSSVDDFDVNDLPGSPAVRRTVNQAKRIVDEIVGIAGRDPKNIFIEVTRDEDGRNKGRRTKRRYDAIKEAVVKLKKEQKEVFNKEVLDALNAKTPADLDDERLVLYFMQNGKCMYCGKPLEINQLDKYQVDHILPQSYIKDDSFENKALVYSEYNQRKTNSMLLDNSIIANMRPFWEALHSVGLIGDKKFKNLTRTSVGDKELGGFIARQMVETSQSMKLASLLLEKKYPGTAIRSVKAGFSSDLRRRLKLVKCREINDYHHAHDAYLACEVGQFITMRHPKLYDNPIGYTHAVKSFIKNRAEYAQKHGKPMYTYGMPGSSSFVISSFLTSGFDEETGEIFKDAWSAETAAARIHKALNRKDCYISRMPEETSGAFWDATIYSPKQSKKKLSLPLKKGLDPEKYGSYSREQFAYFFVYEASKLKKKEQVKEYVFTAVPVQVAAMVAANQDALIDFAKNDAESRGTEFVRIVREKVYKYQLIEFNDGRLYITGLESVRNAKQIAFTERERLLISQLSDDKAIAQADAIALYDVLIAKFEKYANRLGNQLRLTALRNSFQDAGKIDQTKVLLSLIAIFNAKTNMIDLSSIGSGKNVGNMRLSIAKAASEDGSSFAFVDQSVTGMFERKTYL